MNTTPFFTRLFYLLVCLASLWTAASQAQSRSAPPAYSQVSIASPTAASLGKFTDIPVSYHTGIPQISVPIYTVKEGPLSLPISLSYHAGGIKVQEPASWVGTGWALNAGGVITRTIVGAPDESGTTIAVKGHFSDYGYSSYLMTGSVVGNSSTMRPGPNDNAIANAFYDGEPDLFFFNFNGYSGKFYFSDDRTPVVLDGQDLKIEYYYPRESSPTAASSMGDNNIQGFIITVPTGDKYYFGSTDKQSYGPTSQAGDKPVEMTYSNAGDSPGVDNNVYSSYYLSKIVAADGVHTIRFRYQREQYSYYTLLTSPITNDNNFDASAVSLASENIDGVRLANISFSTGTIDFNAAGSPRTDLGSYLFGETAPTEARALDNIKIANSASDFCKQFFFTYSYFGGDDTKQAAALLTPDGSPIQTDKTRLKLDKILEKSCDGTLTINPWKFEYNGSFLPRRLSYAQDHWGFYNGANNNNLLNTLIPTYSFGQDGNGFPDSEIKGANRDPDAKATAAGILTKMTYPTGGTVAFEYEPNDVWVAYTKYSSAPAFSSTLNRKWYASYWNNYTFKAGVYYRITIDYQHSTNCRFTGPAHADFSDGNLYVGASKEYPHFQRITQLAAGTRRFTFDMSAAECDDDQASLSVEELVKRDIQENALAGGLRIKKIISQADAQTPALVTAFGYREANGHSSGTLFNRPRYVQVVRNDLLGQLGFSADGSDAPYNLTPHGCLGPETNNNRQAYLRSPATILPMSTTQGNHIGYSRVTVTHRDTLTHRRNGRTEYRYYCTSDQDLSTAQDLGKVSGDVCYRTINNMVCDPTIPQLPATPARFEFNRGQLAAETDYNEQGQLLKQVQYTYQYDSSRIVTPAYLSKRVAGALLGGTYERRGYWKKQTSVVETTYSTTGQPFVKSQTAYYDSPYHHQLTRLVETAPSGQVLETRHQYAFDFGTPAYRSINDGTAAYDQACRRYDSNYARDFDLCTTMGCKFNAYITHINNRVSARQAYVAYRRQNFTDPTNTYQTAHDQAKSAADKQLQPLLQLQDAGHNEEVETSNWRNKQLLSASYTVFGAGLSQPTTMYPAKQFGLFLPSPTTTFTSAAVSGNGIGLDPRYATSPETMLKFDKGNVVEVRAKTGIITSYLWDDTYTLPIAKAIGVNYATLSAAYRGGNLSTLRTAPALANSLLTTYVHRPLVGMLTQTDPTGRTISYEYDALGRLLRTRDEQGRILSQLQYHYAGQ